MNFSLPLVVAVRIKGIGAARRVLAYIADNERESHFGYRCELNFEGCTDPEEFLQSAAFAAEHLHRRSRRLSAPTAQPTFLWFMARAPQGCPLPEVTTREFERRCAKKWSAVGPVATGWHRPLEGSAAAPDYNALLPLAASLPIPRPRWSRSVDPRTAVRREIHRTLIELTGSLFSPDPAWLDAGTKNLVTALGRHLDVAIANGTSVPSALTTALSTLGTWEWDLRGNVRLRTKAGHTVVLPFVLLAPWISAALNFSPDEPAVKMPGESRKKASSTIEIQ